MREIRTSGSMRGCRKRTAMQRACVLLYIPPALTSRLRDRPKMYGRGQASGKCVGPKQTAWSPACLTRVRPTHLFADTGAAIVGLAPW